MLLKAENITSGYHGRAVLKNVSVAIGKGEIVSLLGPNGSGKTTLLKVLIGLHGTERGRVLLEGRDISSLKQKYLARRIAYVPQFHRTSFSYRVIDVVLMGRLPHKNFFARYNKEDTDLARQALEKLSILHLEERPYTEISGGERQLALIARAMAQGAHTFIFDEPANGLDYGNQIKLLEELMNLCDQGYTFIKSTHFPDHALWVADRVVMLKQGAILAEGTPDEIITGNNLYRLYGREVDVHALKENFKVCVPSRLCRCKMHGWSRQQPEHSMFMQEYALR